MDLGEGQPASGLDDVSISALESTEVFKTPLGFWKPYVSVEA